jgi:hypothetical protein
LCQHCAEKWVKGHKCAQKVQLHALQEVLDLFQSTAEPEDIENPTGTDTQVFLTVPIAAVSRLSTPKTLCLQGLIQQQQIRILVDFGSSHTFINSQLASQLQGVRELPTCLFVQVANGNKLQRTSHIPRLLGQWMVISFTLTSRYFLSAPMI